MGKIFMPTMVHLWKCPKCGKVLAAGQGQKTRVLGGTKTVHLIEEIKL